MTTRTIPVPVDDDLQKAAEDVLQDGETVPALAESALRDLVDERRRRADFIAEGQATLEQYKLTGKARPAAAVFAELRELVKTRRAEFESEEEAALAANRPRDR